MKTKKILSLFIIALFSLGFFTERAYSSNNLHAVQFKNESAVAANDFHAEMSSTGTKIATASAKNDATGNQAFPDKVFDPATSSWDWPASSNLEPIPAGKTMTVLSEPGAVNTATSYFTRDGIQIATSAKAVAVKLSSAGENTGAFSITNHELFPVECTSMQVYVDNLTNPLSFAGWSPTGSLATGIPSTVTLLPGQTLAYTFTYTNPGYYVSSHFFAAYTSEPLNKYEFTDSHIQSALIPTLSQWGLIVLGGILLIIGSVYLYRRKRLATAL